MVILTALGSQIETPLLIAFDESIWTYHFGGDETYIDDQSVEFYWAGRQKIIQILDISIGINRLSRANSIGDLKLIDEGWFFDASTQRLYVKWPMNAGDWSINRALTKIQVQADGFSNRVVRNSPPIYDENLYKPIISGMSNFTYQVDSRGTGLISLDKASIRMVNANGAFDNDETLRLSGGAVSVVAVDEGVSTASGALPVFTGFISGGKIGETDREITVNDYRILYDRDASPGVLEVSEYPALDNKYIGKRKPTAWGRIRRGALVPLNSSGVGKGDAADIDFMVADDAIGTIRLVSNVYDDNGELVSFTQPTANTVRFSKPARSSQEETIKLESFTWEGEGYDIPGTFDNGLDIMKAAFDRLSSIEYVSSFFDISAWDSATAANPQAVGLSIRSEKGVISELVEPIARSLRGSVILLADGRITYKSENIQATPTKSYPRRVKTNETDFDIRVDSLFSSVTVSYARNSVDNDDVLTVIDNSFRDSVVVNYGVDTSADEYETVLFNESDALSLASKLALLYSKPRKELSINIPLDPSTVPELYETIAIDDGRFSKESFNTYEVFQLTYNYMESRVEIKARYLREGVV